MIDKQETVQGHKVTLYSISAKFVLKKRLNTSLKDLSLAFTNHGWHGLFFIFKFLAYLSFT